MFHYLNDLSNKLRPYFIEIAQMLKRVHVDTLLIGYRTTKLEHIDSTLFSDMVLHEYKGLLMFCDLDKFKRRRCARCAKRSSFF